jgi:hypothetical protein
MIFLSLTRPHQILMMRALEQASPYLQERPLLIRSKRLIIVAAYLVGRLHSIAISLHVQCWYLLLNDDEPDALSSAVSDFMLE